MTVVVGLRLVAIAIAVLALADPVLTRRLPVPQPLAIVILSAGALDRQEQGSARTDEAWQSADTLRAALRRDYDVSVSTHVRDAASAACPEGGGCIVVSDAGPSSRLTSGATVLGAVRVGETTAPNISIASAESVPPVHLNAVARLVVSLRGLDARGRSLVEVMDDGVLVGSTTHEWKPDGAGGEATARVAIDWTPIAEGPRKLRVIAGALDGEKTLLDNQIDVGVEVTDDRTPLLMYEPEATWLGTFVRRALEGDPRFLVHGRTRLAPSLAITRGTEAGPLTARALRRVGTVIVSTPERLGAEETELLHRFVVVRGGSLIVLLDRAPTGPAAGLLPPVTGERRATEPVAIGSLKASELLTFDSAAPGLTVLASVDDRPVVVSRALGAGHVIVSGALDAWRHREGGGFARFWSSMVADASAAAGTELELTIARPVIRPDQATEITLTRRSIDGPPPTFTAQALVRCGSSEEPVRLLPAGRPGVVTGRVAVGKTGTCRVEASVSDPGPLSTSAGLLVTTDVQSAIGDHTALAAAVSAHGGITVQTGQESTLAEAVRQRMPGELRDQPTRPMRSPWWIVPFAACLSAEWWVRRRAGLR